jgi:hypothetical protein
MFEREEELTVILKLAAPHQPQKLILSLFWHTFQRRESPPRGRDQDMIT